uniref:Tetratricopeptide (TPR) repeat n=1 Tax=Candidatus Kentrum sp. DK TaxID=2126562 RepID=A0A450SIK5_9GAMM|nr:MAG: Tetratricopeptide (TPR) repeat [Candidatus Kentron sp. DK]
MTEPSIGQAAPSPDQTQGQVNNIQPINRFISEFGTQIVVAIVVAVTLFFVGGLGLNRLGQIDSAFTDFRRLVSEQLLEERKLSATERRDFRDDINTWLKGISSTIEAVSEQHVAKALQKRQEQADQAIKRVEDDASARITKIEEKLKPYAWLESRSEEVDSLVGIDSIGVAQAKVTELFQEKKSDMAIRVAKQALDSNISGDPDDFHNLAAELGRQNLYSLASRVVLRGLEYFPQNVDLLSSGIKYLSSNGAIDEADKLTERLRAIPKEYWNWRAFVFLGDYFELRGRFDEAFALYDAFKQQLPHDERAYAQHGSVFKKWGNHDKAIAIFEEGLRKTRKAPQTALMLAESYIEVGEYAKAIAATERGIEGTAIDQPTANIAAIFWTRATARDALIHTNQITEQAELAKSIGLAISDYQAAMSMPDRLVQHRYRGPQRIQVLQLYARNHGIGIQVDDDGDERRDLLNLLQQLGENQEGDSEETRAD